MSERIEQIVIESKMTLRDIAWFYSSYRPHLTNSEYMGAIHREDLAKVIKGLRNTPRYVTALEEAWKISIADIRRVYREDKLREKEGRAYTGEEIVSFMAWYREQKKSREVA